jgi:hypothetical protein
LVVKEIPSLLVRGFSFSVMAKRPWDEDMQGENTKHTGGSDQLIFPATAVHGFGRKEAEGQGGMVSEPSAARRCGAQNSECPDMWFIDFLSGWGVMNFGVRLGRS